MKPATLQTVFIMESIMNLIFRLQRIGFVKSYIQSFTQIMDVWFITKSIEVPIISINF